MCDIMRWAYLMHQPSVDTLYSIFSIIFRLFAEDQSCQMSLPFCCKSYNCSAVLYPDEASRDVRDLISQWNEMAHYLLSFKYYQRGEYCLLVGWGNHRCISHLRAWSVNFLLASTATIITSSLPISGTVQTGSNAEHWTNNKKNPGNLANCTTQSSIL